MTGPTPVPHHPGSLAFHSVPWRCSTLKSGRITPSGILGSKESAVYPEYGTSVVLTTNLPFEQWTEVLGSERLVGATLDRLAQRCHILEATGESYRLRDAKRRQATGPGAKGRRREPAAPSEK